MDLKEIGMYIWVDLSGLGQGAVAGSCEHGNEPSSSINGGEFLN
jgi:hypothetical protein